MNLEKLNAGMHAKDGSKLMGNAEVNDKALQPHLLGLVFDENHQPIVECLAQVHSGKTETDYQLLVAVEDFI